MAINTSLLIAAPMLQDFLQGKNGLPLAGGVITMYQDNSRTTLKNWYYQAGVAGAYTYLALPNPLTLSAAGTICDANGVDTIPFYYPFDEQDDTLVEPYYVTVYNSAGQQEFTRQNFPFNISENSTTTGSSLANLIINNQFWRNIGSADVTNLTETFVFGYPTATSTIFKKTVAPSQHDGFTMPDINYLKNASGGPSDTVSFVKFPQGTSPVLQNDITPEFFIEHVCAGSGGGESIKCYQFPISLHLQTLDLAEFTVTIQAINNGSGPSGSTITLKLYQFAGTGKTSIAPISIGTPIVLDTVWTKYSRTLTFPSDTGIDLTSPGDDAWFLQVTLTPNVALDISFTLPSIFLGTQIPSNSFTTYDEVNAIISSPRTGDLRTSINDFHYFGWVPMNGGTICNAGSITPPTNGGFARQNVDTWPLFNLLWNKFATYSIGTPSSGTNALAQMYNSSGVAVAYGPNISPATTAIADWTAGNQLEITDTMAKVILGTAPASVLLPPFAGTFTASNSGGNILITTTAPITGIFNGMPIVFTTTGTQYAEISSPTVFYVANFNGTNQFNVATLFSNATANPAVVIAWTGTATSGTQTVYSAYNGAEEGEYSHVQAINELAAHHHTVSTQTSNQTGPAGGASAFITVVSQNTSTTGASSPFNVTQPGIFMNYFMKL